MKASRRNIKNAHARAEKRSKGVPPISKYAKKTRGLDNENPNLDPDYRARLAEHFKGIDQ